MSRTVSFSMSEEEFAVLEVKAGSKGLTRSQFAKMATFDHINQHPPKGVMAEITRLRANERRSDGAESKSEGASE